MTRAHDGHAECCLNWNVYHISVICEFYLERNVITLKLCKEYLNTVTHNIPVLLWKKLNSLIYRTLFYVNIQGGPKKTGLFFDSL